MERGIGLLTLRQRTHGITIEPHRPPLWKNLCAQPRVERNSIDVPIEHLPLDACAAATRRFGGEVLHEKTADTEAAELRPHEEVFEVEDRPPFPSRVLKEVERKARRSHIRALAPLCNEDMKQRVLTETIAKKIVDRRRHRGEIALVFREFFHERQHQWSIGGYSPPNGKRGIGHSARLALMAVLGQTRAETQRHRVRSGAMKIALPRLRAPLALRAFPALAAFPVFLAALPLSALSVAACSSDDGNSYDSLFDLPTNAQNTANSVRGLWATQIQRNEVDGLDAAIEVRMHISDTDFVLAGRCTYADNTVITGGVSVGLQLDEQQSALITTESKEDAPTANNHTCRVAIQAATLQYSLNGRELIFQGSDLPYPKLSTATGTPPFSKLSD